MTPLLFLLLAGDIVDDSLTVRPVGDGRVFADFPNLTGTGGSDEWLQVRQTPAAHSLLSFDLRRFANIIPISAKLRLVQHTTSTTGRPQVHSVTGGPYVENVTTWNTSPALDDLLVASSVGTVAAGTVLEFDLPADWIVDNIGTVATLRLTAPGGGSVDSRFWAREAPDPSVRPQLIITFESLLGDLGPVDLFDRSDVPWSIDLCRGWERIGTVDAFEFTGVERMNAAGEWSLTCALDSVEWGGRDVGGYSVPWGPLDVDTVRLVEGRRIRFAGYVGAPVGSGRDGSGGIERTVQVDGNRVTWSGPDLWDLLDRRLAWPDPAGTPPWSVGHDTRSGVASTVIASYLAANLGELALPERQVDGFAIVDGGAGPTGTWSARLQTLGALVARIASDAGLVVRPTVDFAGEVRVLITAPRDLSDRFTLADEGDVASITARDVPASASWVLAGGQGELAARTFYATGGGTGEARREVWSDQSSLADEVELQLAAAAARNAGMQSWSVQAELADAVADWLDLGNTTKVGDTIAVQFDGRRYSVPITSAALSVTPERQVVRPVLGAAAPDLLSALVRDVAGLGARLDTAIA